MNRGCKKFLNFLFLKFLSIVQTNLLLPIHLIINHSMKLLTDINAGEQKIYERLIRMKFFYMLQKLSSDGSSDFAKILDFLIKNPNKVEQVKAFCENKIKTPFFSIEKCLALFLSLNLSKQQYIELRKICIESGTNQWQSYYEMQRTKLECYPSKNKITITETSASIDLQVLLDLTTKRLLNVCKDNVDVHNNNINNLTLICKWGCDGASNQSMHKQNFLNENASDSCFYDKFRPC